MLKNEFIFFIFLFTIQIASILDANSFKKITILSTTNVSGRGPDSVVRSLVAGLQEINVDYNHNPEDDAQIGDVVVVLSDIGMLSRAINLKRSGQIKLLLAGPNLMIKPSEHNNILSSAEIDRVIVPCDWVRTAYTEQEPSLTDHIAMWYAGVDAARWMPAHESARDTNKVLVYWKTEPESFCIEVENTLRKFGFDPVRIRYGAYNQGEYKNILEQVRFAVFISISESQGIALAEAWAMNVPTINWDPETLVAHGRVYSECSSCPYLSVATGLRWKNIGEFETILGNLDSYEFSPREWVLNNMTDRVSAKELLETIEKQIKI